MNQCRHACVKSISAVVNVTNNSKAVSATGIGAQTAPAIIANTVALNANFSGVSDPYEPPHSPEITIHTDRENVETSRDTILRWLETRQLI